jgi:hypothetical protein
MKISTYNPVDMSLVADDVTGVDFSSVVRGGYSAPVVVKPVATTETFTQLAFFLENDADLTGTSFRSYKSATAIPGIGTGSEALSDDLTEQAGVSDFSNIGTISGDGQILSASNPEYIWLDVKIGAADTVGTANVNYRFIFEYS